jgi:hypothetical protein
VQRSPQANPLAGLAAAQDAFASKKESNAGKLTDAAVEGAKGDNPKNAPGGGAPQSGPDYGGDAGAIDLGPDAVQTTAGGRSEDPGEFFGKRGATRELPNRSQSSGSSSDSDSGDESGSAEAGSNGSTQTTTS